MSNNLDYLDINPDFLTFVNLSDTQSLHRASDGSLFVPSDLASASSSENEQRRSSKATKRGVSSFINKLYNLINDPRHQNLIYWSPNGTSFFIRNIKRFSDQVLPEYFKHGNFSSFVRLLNMYGFHKVNKSARGQRGNENEIWEFSHAKFQRERPDLLRDIRRKTMDSETLRREAGDFQIACSTLQISQSDLQRQFQALEENFSNLLQGFEETRKMQSQQQFLLSQLAERQGLSLNQLFDLSGDNSPACLSPASFQVALNTPLPPSPAPSFQLDPNNLMWDGSKVPTTPPLSAQQQLPQRQQQQRRPRSFVV